MKTTITIDPDLLQDLKLVKRVQGKKNMTEVIRGLMIARGYDDKWLKHMRFVLQGESE